MSEENVKLQPGDEGYDEAMAAKLDAANADAAKDTGIPNAAPPVKPDWVPAKFWDAEKGEVMTEEMSKSYASLEQKLSSNEKPAADDGDANADEPGDEAAVPDSVDQSLQDQVVDEYMEKGELSEDTYAKFEKIGISKEMVDDYIAGQEARSVGMTAELTDIAGGPDEFTAIVQWGKQNLSEGEFNAFQNSMGQSMEAAKLAIYGLKGRYVAAEGSAPQLRSGNNSNPSTGAAYESRAQMTADMKDPRYKIDPAFQQAVINKIANTPDGII